MVISSPHFFLVISLKGWCKSSNLLIWWNLCWFIYLFVQIFTFLFIFPSTYLSFCLFVSLFIYPFLWLSAYLSKYVYDNIYLLLKAPFKSVFQNTFKRLSEMPHQLKCLKNFLRLLTKTDLPCVLRCSLLFFKCLFVLILPWSTRGISFCWQMSTSNLLTTSAFSFLLSPCGTIFEITTVLFSVFQRCIYIDDMFSDFFGYIV